jgi:hypothetical protein
MVCLSLRMEWIDSMAMFSERNVGRNTALSIYEFAESLIGCVPDCVQYDINWTNHDDL